MPKKVQEEVGDLFVTETAVTVKLLPSKRSTSRAIRWFAGGRVTNVKVAAREIALIIGKLQGRTRVVKGLTVMTDGGTSVELADTGLFEAVRKAGFEVIC